MDNGYMDILFEMFNEEEKGVENDAELVHYLSEINDGGVENIRSENLRIREEISQTTKQTQNLTFQNYTAFVQTAACSSEVLKYFGDVEERLGHLLAELPEFTDRCTEFSRLGAGIQSRRRLNSITLAKHTQLLEVLELAQLMDTCVRNGYLNEAMELVAHVQSLQRKHVNIPLIASIAQDVQGSYKLMLTQLLSQLKSNLQLPQCMKIVGHLRRMEVYTELELRLRFLLARDVWFNEQVNSISRDDPYHHISKTIEVSRMCLFDIVTQYRAVFSDESGLLVSSSDDAPPAVFYEWISLKVEQFLDQLRCDLERGVGPRLDSLLSQTMYFGQSMARIGADFRPLLVPIFQRAALRRLTADLAAATLHFTQYMDVFTFMKSPGAAGSLALNNGDSDPNSLHAPLTLLYFLPLAHFCNGVLSALNELRLCPALSLVGQLRTILSTNVEAVVGHVVDLYHTDSQGFSETERLNFGRFCSCLAADLIPYLDRCLRAVFPAETLAQSLGVTTAAVLKSDLGALDIASLVKPLVSFIEQPVLEEPLEVSAADEPSSDQAATTEHVQCPDEVDENTTNDPSGERVAVPLTASRADSAGEHAGEGGETELSGIIVHGEQRADGETEHSGSIVDGEQRAYGDTEYISRIVDGEQRAYGDTEHSSRIVDGEQRAYGDTEHSSRIVDGEQRAYGDTEHSSRIVDGEQRAYGDTEHSSRIVDGEQRVDGEAEHSSRIVDGEQRVDGYTEYSGRVVDGEQRVDGETEHSSRVVDGEQRVDGETEHISRIVDGEQRVDGETEHISSIVDGEQRVDGETEHISRIVDGEQRVDGETEHSSRIVDGEQRVDGETT